MPVRRVVRKGGISLEIAGRIDGVFHRQERVALEEIKTTWVDLETITREADPRHWGQVLLYGAMWAHSKNLKTLDLQLTYYHWTTAATREVRKSFRSSELEAVFQEAAEGYINWQLELSDCRRTRDASLAALTFPFPERRAGQEQIEDAVRDVSRSGGSLLIEAPTGTGKTVAVLFGALQGLALGQSERILYLTARTTGKETAETALECLAKGGLDLKRVTMTARSRICFNPEKACNGDDCSYARGYYERISAARRELLENDRLDRATLEELAGKHHVCPFELSRELARWADCIIGDFNHAFDPVASLKTAFSDQASSFTILVDEAHNLPDRARQMHSASWSRRDSEALLLLDLDRSRTRPSALADPLMKDPLSDWWNERWSLCRCAGGAIIEDQPPEELCRALESSIEGLAEGSSWTRVSSSGREGILEARRFLKVARDWDENYSTIYQSSDSDLRVKLFCFDPGPRLREIVQSCHSAVFLSATLSPLGHHARLFGCAEPVRQLRVSSPFSDGNLCLLVGDRISTRFRDRAASQEEVTRVLSAFVREREGHYMLFFPSYAYLELIRASFPDVSGANVECLSQNRSMTEEDRAFFLQRFRRRNRRTLVGFAVLGGFFGEGIDLVGDHLAGAAIVGVGLPGISPEREVIRRFYDQQGERGYDFAYVYPGMIRVRQAAGRVIRSESDRGAVLLVDDRYSSPAYQSLLPEEWNPRPVRSEDQVEKELGSFWRGRPSAATGSPL